MFAFREIRTNLDYYLLTTDRKHLEAAAPLRGKVEKWLADAERWGTAPDEQQMMGRVRRGQIRFFADLDRLLAEPGPAPVSKVNELIDGLLVPELVQPTEEYLTLNANESDESIRENQVFATWLVAAFLLLGICGSGAGLITGFGFARAFQRSLVQLSLPIRAAAGHLDEVVGPVTFTANADFREMENMLQRIADRIGAIVERLRQSEREVLRAEQLAAVGQMAAGMAHELRNPLTSMKILVQAALGGQRSFSDLDGAGIGMGSRDLIVLEEEITRLERLVQSFLHFAQPPQLETRVQNVKQLVAESIKLIAHRAALCGTRIELTLPEAAVDAAVDAGQLRQVLLNLLANALDATGSGGVIWVDLRTEPDGWIQLRVADTGRGLPAALGPRIFSPFVTTKETGLGLGLSICKRIIEAHGGEIAGANRPEGGGAVFTIRLPGARSQKSEVRSQRSEVRSQSLELNGPE
jgi:signal transduction histidine kinase